MTDFIIPGEGLELRVSRVGDLIEIWHNGGTRCFTIEDAGRLVEAVNAVISGYPRAITETAARLEAERAARAPATQSRLTSLNLSDIGL